MEEDLDEKFWRSLKIMGLDQEDLADISRDKLKKTWRAWVLVNHQDRTGNKEAHQEYKEAYDFLMDMMMSDEDSFEYIVQEEDAAPGPPGPERLYSHADICRLASLLLQYRCWILHVRRGMPEIGRTLAKWSGSSWTYTYPSWVHGSVIFEQRSSSTDHIRLVQEILEVSPFSFYLIRIPPRMGARSKAWVIWKGMDQLFHSLSMYPVE